MKAKNVRYEVKARTFVNGNLVEPGDGKPKYVMAEAGLEGKALKLAPENAAPTIAATVTKQAEATKK